MHNNQFDEINGNVNLMNVCYLQSLAITFKYDVYLKRIKMRALLTDGWNSAAHVALGLLLPRRVKAYVRTRSLELLTRSLCLVTLRNAHSYGRGDYGDLGAAVAALR